MTPEVPSLREIAIGIPRPFAEGPDRPIDNLRRWEIYSQQNTKHRAEPFNPFAPITPKQRRRMIHKMRHNNDNTIGIH